MAKFQNFVAGDDGEAPSTGSASYSEADVGPFAKFTGGTPTISRSPSHADVGSAFGQMPPSALPNSRYAPAYTPQQPSSQGALMSTPPSQGQSFESTYAPFKAQPSTQTPPIGATPYGVANPSYPDPQPDPLGLSQRSYGYPSTQANDNESSKVGNISVEPIMNGYSPAANGLPSSVGSYNPQNAIGFGTQGGDDGGYAPPSYQPYEPDNSMGPDSPESSRPKRFMMDDDGDDDLTKKQEKARRDKEADESFRKAAEEDGMFCFVPQN